MKSSAVATYLNAHANAVSLHFMYYDFCKIHSELRVTPAKAAQVTHKAREVSDIAAILYEQGKAIATQKRGQYKKKAKTAFSSLALPANL